MFHAYSMEKSPDYVPLIAVIPSAISGMMESEQLGFQLFGKRIIFNSQLHTLSPVFQGVDNFPRRLLRKFFTRLTDPAGATTNL